MEEQTYGRMPLIGDLAPSFVAKTTQGEIHFPEMGDSLFPSRRLHSRLHNRVYDLCHHGG
jgi:hypothetical protein